MTEIITLSVYSLVFFINSFAAYRFYKSKDGILRKIMIAWLLARATLVLFAALYYLQVVHLNVWTFRAIVLLPEALTGSRLLYFLIYNK